MKKYFLMLCVALMPMVALTSCSDDDDEKPVPTLADQVEGTFAMKMKVSVNQPEPYAEAEEPETPTEVDAQIKLTEKTENQVSFEIADFAFGTSTISLEAFDLALTGETADVVVAFNGKIKVTMSTPSEEEGGEPTIVVFDEVPVLVSGDVKEAKTMNLDIRLVIEGVGSIHVTAEGTKN